MGNEPSNRPINNLKNWIKLSEKQGQNLYKNRIDGVIGQKRSIFIDKRLNLQDQLQIYRWRRNNNQALVKTYDAEIIEQENQQFNNPVQKICFQSNLIDVIIQPIPKRLFDLPQLTFKESLYVLRQTIKAYGYSYAKIGPFHISQKMIGLNNFGEIKSWVNQNWADNQPNHHKGRLRSTSGLKDQKKQSYLSIEPQYRLQSQMVVNLVNVVESKCQNGRFPKDFSDNMYLRGSNFHQAQLFLKQYVNAKNIRMPNKILQNFIEHSFDNMKTQSRIPSIIPKKDNLIRGREANKYQNKNVHAFSKENNLGFINKISNRQNVFTQRMNQGYSTQRQPNFNNRNHSLTQTINAHHNRSLSRRKISNIKFEYPTTIKNQNKMIKINPQNTSRVSPYKIYNRQQNRY